MEQEIRFCTAPDGARIAYASVGDGPPLVKTANWLNHLQFDWESPVFRHFFRELSSHHRLIRYDERGNGLSDWSVQDFSFEKMVDDLETVVDAAGIDRFALLGISQGCAISIAYAVRHPERVDKLILYGGYACGWRARGDAEEIRRRQALITLTREGWGTDSDAYRQVFTSLYIPDGTAEQVRWFNDLQRITTSPENAALLQEALGDVDVRSILPQVRVPTLVLHARHDAAVPFAAGREVAAGIPGARFVAIESRNHLLLEHDVVWTRFRDEVRAFLGIPAAAKRSPGEDAWKRADDLFEALLDRPEEERRRELARPEHDDIRTRVERLLASVSRAGDGLVTGGGWMAAPKPGPGADDAGGAGALPPGFSPGKRIADRYLLQEPIGRGGMGVVFRARDALLAREVAVKVAASAAESRGFRERVLREARSAAALNHPHVVAIHDVGETEGLVYLVLELICGPTLEESPPRGAEQVLAVARQICDALEHAHRRGVVHRDLKPANVMWADGPGKGPVKLADLGIALVRTDPRITGTGHILGTPAYMAPEQALGRTPDARTDLYALGVMMYEWLTGSPPFEADTPLAVVSQHVHAAPVPPRGRRPDVPPSLDRIVCRLLEKQPEDRFASAAALRAALDAVDEPLQPTVALRPRSAETPGPGASSAGRTEAYEWYLRGVHHFLRGGAADLEQARQWFQRSLQADEGYASSWAGLSLCSSWVHLYHGGSEESRREAVTAGARAVELNPALGEARCARGLALSLEDRDVEAQEEFERAMSLDPKLFEARYLYGRFCYSRGMPERAAALLAEAESLRPDEMQTPGLLGKTLRGLGREEEAVAAFGRALGLAEKRIALDAQDPRALTNGARALIALGRTEEGLQWAKRARRLHPGHPMLYYVACAYAAADDDGSALDCLEEIVAAGWRDFRWLDADGDLGRVRSDPRFVTLRGK